MIPKILHYIWLGGKPAPPFVKSCVASWQRFAPCFEIKRWDEGNLNMHANALVEAGMEKRKYAFAANFFRWDILHRYGGIYLDTDVELLQPIDALCEGDDALFAGAYAYHFVDTAVIGCAKGCSIAQRMASLLAEGCRLAQHTSLFNETLHDMGYRWDDRNADDEVQRTGDVTIYPKYRFYPKSCGYSLNPQLFRSTTLMVHHYANSWVGGGAENLINELRTYNDYNL